VNLGDSLVREPGGEKEIRAPVAHDISSGDDVASARDRIGSDLLSGPVDNQQFCPEIICVAGKTFADVDSEEHIVVVFVDQMPVCFAADIRDDEALRTLLF
jgi:hypothetical protein